jgi:adenylylsulfate kinase
MSWAIWITGPPASGKSTLARATAGRLREAGVAACVLELDAMRRVVTPSPSYSDTERHLVYRALVWLAAAVTHAGVPVIVDATAHRREWRDLARVSIPHFAEIELRCSLETCRARDAARAMAHATAGVYAHAGNAGARVPGVDVAYEPAAAPELTIDTDATPPEVAATRVCELARRLPTPPGQRAGEGWAIWITGLPGSGKTTIAAGAEEALARYGIAVRVLEVGDLLDFITGCDGSPLAELVAHRTLIYAAKVLSEHGVPLIVDATAPPRAWRELARELIARFAEVQLLCPAEVCATRERAVRWHLMGCAHSPPRRRRSDGPDITLDYEPSLRAELTIHTDVEDPWAAAAAVVRLARRLHRMPPQRTWTQPLAG